MELEGKVIEFLGDSITEGCGVSDPKNNRFDNVIGREYKLKAWHNHGIGGTKLAHQTKASDKPRFDLCFCGRIYNVWHGADALVVFGGTNDYGHGDAPFGKMGDTTPNTFCGAVHFLMSYAKENFLDKGKKVLFLAPARRFGDEKPSDHPYKTGDALPLYEYNKIIIETGKQFGIPVLDLYNELGINPNDDSERETYTTDGLHFNDAGHALIAKKVAEALLNI